MIVRRSERSEHAVASFLFRNHTRFGRHVEASSVAREAFHRSSPDHSVLPAAIISDNITRVSFVKA